MSACPRGRPQPAPSAATERGVGGEGGAWRGGRRQSQPFTDTGTHVTGSKPHKCRCKGWSILHLPLHAVATGYMPSSAVQRNTRERAQVRGQVKLCLGAKEGEVGRAVWACACYLCSGCALEIFYGIDRCL